MTGAFYRLHQQKKWVISAKFQGIGIQFYSQFGSAIIEEDL